MEKRNTMDTSTQASALRWETIIDKMEDYICLLDADFNIIKINKAMREFLGRPEEDIIGKKCWTLIHGTAEPPDFCPMTKMVESKKRESVTIQLKGRYLRVTVDPVLDEEGLIRGAVHIIRDIDESERNNLSIRESEKKYHELVNTMSDVVFTLDFDGGVIDASPTMERIIGWSVKESIGKRFSDFVHPDDLSKAEEEFLRAIQGKGHPIEIRLIPLNGISRWVRINALLIMKDGEPDNLLCVLTDIHEKKLAEEALRERDVRVRKLVALVPGMIYQFTKRADGAYCVPFSTDAIKDFFGCSPEDVREDFSPIAKVILPEDLDKVVSSIEYSAEHLTVWKCEFRVQIPGQSIRWMLGHSTPEKSADGSITWYGFNTDITERKRAEEELTSAQTRLKEAHHLAHIGAWDWLIENDTVIWSEELYDIAGRDPSLPAPTYAEHPHHYTPTSWERLDCAVKNALTTGEPYNIELELVRPDGSTRWTNAIGGVKRDEGGKVIGLHGILQDITERKLAEERLRESEGELKEANAVLREERDKVQHYLDDVRAIIVILDRNGNVALINKKGCEILGRSESDIIGKDWFENFLPENVRTEVKRVFNELMAGRIEIVENYDNPVLASDGQIRTISWHNALLRDESGKIISTLSAGEDITERIQMEMDLKVATENLTQINTNLIDARLRSQTYFDFLAHDIANILSPIMAYAELISKGEQYPPEVVSFTKKIVDQAQKATSLIHNLRKLEMLEDKNLPDMNIVDIKRIFSFVENSIRHKYPEKKPTFVYHLPEEIPIKSRGGEYIDFVIRHVFDNAVRHAQRDTVNIDVRIDKEGENVGGKFWRIIIEDDGPGISDRMKKEITTPLDPAKRYSRGVASSLAFCSAAVIGIGGGLHIEDRVPNDQSKGTRVTVWIPVYD